jgi:dienelactone hydrolase
LDGGGQSLARRWRFVTALAWGLLLLACDGPGKRDAISFEPPVITDSLLWRRGGEELRLVRLRDERGTVHEGWLRQVPQGDSARASVPGKERGATPDGRLSVLILGGVGTQRRAAEIVPCPPGVTVLALDYPYTGDRRPTRANLFTGLPAIRRSSTATPRGVRAAIRYLATRPGADPRGVLVIGASFGGSYVLRAIQGLPRGRGAEGRDLGPRDVRAVAILYWGAGQPDMARYRMRERPLWERELVAGGLWLFFSDLEPEKTVASVSPRPLLLVNGEQDEFVSREAALRLEAAARPPVEHVWLATEHLQPTAEELLRRLVTVTLEWLAARAAEDAPGSAPAGAQPVDRGPGPAGGP